MNGVKGQDVVVLLKLASIEDQAERSSARLEESAYAVRNLEAVLGISKTEVNAAIQRSIGSGLAIRDPSDGHPRPHRRHLHGFIVHGLKFVCPVAPGAMTRGVPTAFDAPMLKGRLLSGGDYVYVWPDDGSNAFGQAVKPLFKSVPQAAVKDERLYEYLALVDGIRLGNPRESGLSADRLAQRLLPA